MRFFRKHLSLFALIAGIVTLCGVVYTVAHTAEQNRQAIEKGCVLLNNAIIRSTQAAADPDSASAALVAGVLEVIPEKYVRQFHQRSAGGATTVVPLVDCQRVAAHPDEIHAVPLEP